MSELGLSYKIIILALLDHAGFRMTESQLSDFMVGAKITDYFTAKDAIISLEESEMINGLSTNNVTYYSINQKGADTLHLFIEKITPEIASDIDEYFEKNELSIRRANGLSADYSRLDKNTYLVSLRYREDENIILDLSLRVPNEDAAKSLCTNWRVRYEDVYATLIDKLM